MGFAVQLKDSLQRREGQVSDEFEKGDGPELILSRYLMAVEAEAESYILTSILLVEGDRLRHGAAPSLPDEYCQAIDGLPFGPCAGSCGTAAYYGRPIYVTDIATDPFWAEYKNLALKHGLRACWSTPIFDDQRNVIATFAIYHPTTGGPTLEEKESIQTITEHVARAITWSRSAKTLTASPAKPA
jgi:GAF domain-containing protein